MQSVFFFFLNIEQIGFFRDFLSIRSCESFTITETRCFVCFLTYNKEKVKDISPSSKFTLLIHSYIQVYTML